MHAWRENNVVYVKTRSDDLLRLARSERLAAKCARPRQRAVRLAYLSGVVLCRVGSQLVRLGRKLQGLLPENNGSVADIALAGPAGEQVR